MLYLPPFSRSSARSVVVSSARSLRRLLHSLLLCQLILSLVALPAWSLPTDGQLRAGSAQIIQTTPDRMDVVQDSHRAVIDWGHFGVDPGQHLNFEQPSANAWTLNRDRGNDPSSIFGRLTANGRVIIVNPYGVHFGSGASVSVASLVATTSNLSTDRFMQGALRFEPGSVRGASITNEGTLTAADGGLVALVAPSVRNDGQIVAHLGKVALAAGDAFTLDLYGDDLIRFALPSSVSDQLFSVETGAASLLAAEGGLVSLSAAQASSAVDSVINMRGVATTSSVDTSGGRIVLRGEGSTIDVAGRLDAQGTTGGAIDVLGASIELGSEMRADASGANGGGAIHIGGDYQGVGSRPRAESLRVADGAEIRADATQDGDGGQVVLWSDGATEFAGSLLARGAGGGSGGRGEVSGKARLRFTGAADLGPGGSLLLDPVNLSVGDATDPDTLSVDTLRQTLITGTDVTLAADENVTIAETIDGRSQGGSTPGGGILITAGTGDATIDGSLITNDGAISIEAGGNVTMAAGTQLVVSDGGTGLGSQNVTVTATGGNAQLERISTGGSATITSGGTLALDQTIVAGGVVAGADSDLTVSGLVDTRSAAGAGIDLDSVSGDVALDASLVTLDGSIEVDAGGDVTSASGTSLFVSNAAGGLGASDIDVTAGGDADLQTLATTGAATIEAGAAATVRRVNAASIRMTSVDALTIRNQGGFAGLDARVGGTPGVIDLESTAGIVRLEAPVISSNQAIEIDAAGGLESTAASQLIVSDGGLGVGTGRIRVGGGGTLTLPNVLTVGELRVASVDAGGAESAVAGGVALDREIDAGRVDIDATGPVTIGAEIDTRIADGASDGSISIATTSGGGISIDDRLVTLNGDIDLDASQGAVVATAGLFVTDGDPPAGSVEAPIGDGDIEIDAMSNVALAGLSTRGSVSVDADTIESAETLNAATAALDAVSRLTVTGNIDARVPGGSGGGEIALVADAGVVEIAGSVRSDMGDIRVEGRDGVTMMGAASELAVGIQGDDDQLTNARIDVSSSGGAVVLGKLATLGAIDASASSTLTTMNTIEGDRVVLSGGDGVSVAARIDAGSTDVSTDAIELASATGAISVASDLVTRGGGIRLDGAGGVTTSAGELAVLTAAADLPGADPANPVLGAGRIDVDASGGNIVLGEVATAGAVDVAADSGGVTLASGVAGGTVDITADSNLNAMASIDTRAPGGTGDGSVSLASTNGDVNVDEIVTRGGDIALSAGGAVTAAQQLIVATAGQDPTLRGNGAIEILSGASTTVAGLATAGEVEVDAGFVSEGVASAELAANAGATISGVLEAGSVDVMARGAIIANDGITVLGGPVSPTLRLESTELGVSLGSSEVVAIDAPIEIAAATSILSSGVISVSDGLAGLEGQSLTLRAADVDVAELQTAGNLVIDAPAGSTTGSVIVRGDVSAGSVEITANESVTTMGTIDARFGEAGAVGGGDISIMALDGALTASGPVVSDSADILLTAEDGLTLSSSLVVSDGTTGVGLGAVTLSGGSLNTASIDTLGDLAATTRIGAATLDGPISAGSVAVTSEGALAANAAIEATSAAGGVALTSNTAGISADSIATSGGGVALNAQGGGLATGGTISVAGGAPGVFGAGAVDLDAAGAIELGDAVETGGAVTIDGSDTAIVRDLQVGSLVLETFADLALLGDIDGRVGSALGDRSLSITSTTGAVDIGGDIVSDNARIAIQAGAVGTGGADPDPTTQQIRMADSTALVVSDGGMGIGSGTIDLEGGNAGLQTIETAGAFELTTIGTPTFGENLGTADRPLGSVAISTVDDLTLPDVILVSNGNVDIETSGDLTMGTAIVVADGPTPLPSDGSDPTPTPGTGDINLAFAGFDATNELRLGDLVTMGGISVAQTALDPTGIAQVVIDQPLGQVDELGQPMAPIGGLDIDAERVDQMSQIVAQGAVSLGRLDGTGQTTLRRNVFTDGGNFEVRNNAVIDPRQALVDSAGNPIFVGVFIDAGLDLVDTNGDLITPVLNADGSARGTVIGINDAGQLVFDPTPILVTRPDQIPRRTARLFGSGDPIVEFDVEFSELAQNRSDLGDIANLRQSTVDVQTFDFRIGEAVNSTWNLLVDTTAATGAGRVDFLGTVDIPTELRGTYPPPFNTTVTQVGGYCSSGGCTETTQSARGRFEFVELNIDAGDAPLRFAESVTPYTPAQLGVASFDDLNDVELNALHLNIEDAASVAFDGEIAFLNLLRAPADILPAPTDDFDPDPLIGDHRFLSVGIIDINLPFPPYRLSSTDGDADGSRETLFVERLPMFNASPPPNSNISGFVAPRVELFPSPTTSSINSEPSANETRDRSTEQFAYSGGGGNLFDVPAPPPAPPAPGPPGGMNMTNPDVATGGTGGMPGGFGVNAGGESTQAPDIELASTGGSTTGMPGGTSNPGAPSGDPADFGGPPDAPETPGPDGSGTPGTNAFDASLSNDDETEETQEETDEEQAAQEELLAEDALDGCSEEGTSAYAMTPAAAAFGGGLQSPFSVDAFCGAYAAVAVDPSSFSEYRGLTYATRDFWTDAAQSRESQILPGLKGEFGITAGLPAVAEPRDESR